MGFFIRDACAAGPYIPPSQDLDIQADRFRREYSEEKRAREKEIAKALTQVEEKKEEAVPPGPFFVLHAVQLTGMTTFPPEKLSFIWKPYLGKKVNFNDLNNIVKLIKRVYKDLGLLTTTAYLPP